MKYFLFILFIGLLIRILLIGNTGFIADISFWKSWSMAAFDHGIVWTSHNTNINYPPGFFYVLYVMGMIYRFFGDPHNYNMYWRENNFAFLLVSKSFAIAADCFIAAGLYWFFAQKKKLEELGLSQRAVEFIEKYHIGLILSSIFFLSPVVIIDSALWGQVESFGIMFTLLAILLIFYKKPTLATVLFTIGFLMKLQNIIYIPLYFLFIYKTYDMRTTVKSFAAMVGAFALVNLPFILSRDINQSLNLMVINNDYFPWLSLNAHNLWWIVAGGKGMTISNKITVVGIANAKTVGLILFSSAYLLSTILLYKKPSPKNFFLALSVGIFSFFMYTAESHERYSYPILVFLLLYFPFLLNKAKFPQENSSKKHSILSLVLLNKPILFFWIVYALFTIGIFFNIHSGLVFNYPENGFSILTHLTTIKLTLFNSYLLILLSLALLYFVFGEISWLLGLVCVGFFSVGIIGVNASYIFENTVSLTAFKPIIISQGYGTLQVNRSVNSEKGWKSWSRLSDDYYFYRKGFGTHAPSNLVFNINGKFSNFATDYGIDTEAGTAASSRFEIWGDGKKLFESETMGRFEFPRHIKVSVKGVKFLGLTVSDNGDGINDDHVDWFNPVLIK